MQQRGAVEACWAHNPEVHRRRREVIAGPIYDWNSYEIPFQIWGGDCLAEAHSARRATFRAMLTLCAFNTFMDLMMLWVLVRMTKSDDFSHPVANLILLAAGPYFLRLAPRLIEFVIPAYSPGYHQLFNDDMFIDKNFERERGYESIMSATVVLTILIGAALTLQGIACSFRNNEPLSRCGIRRRALVPLILCLIFSISYYNHVVHGHRHVKNLPMIVVFGIAILHLLISLVAAFKLMQSNEALTEHQQYCMTMFKSMRFFVLIILIPLIFISHASMVGSLHLLVQRFRGFRFIYIFAIILNEPYAGRIKANRLKSPVKAEEKKEPMDKVTYTYNPEMTQSPPPQYTEKASGGPPSYEVARLEMASPWSSHEVGINDISVTHGITPIQKN
ncbi:unnamed protein product [Caenorhabditis bovis]|uniref:Uncharacterized protein n=1 Tax=Caenorhabditis bovis TaxID=2654633 RepID=A0A8S1EEE9_9PELO|nr:unnamed protein product [Caenorhabditis bovis]